MTDPERLSPSEQRALDEASYRDQLAYLLDRSPFYRRKLAGHDTEGRLDAIAGLPLTEKAELKATSASIRPSSSASTRRAAPRDRRATSL